MVAPADTRDSSSVPRSGPGAAKVTLLSKRWTLYVPSMRKSMEEESPPALTSVNNALRLLLMLENRPELRVTDVANESASAAPPRTDC